MDEGAVRADGTDGNLSEDEVEDKGDASQLEMEDGVDETGCVVEITLDREDGCEKTDHDHVVEDTKGCHWDTKELRVLASTHLAARDELSDITERVVLILDMVVQEID